MTVNKHLPPSAAPRRKRADPTKPRSISAKSRTKNPCTACKHSKQKCLYSLSVACCRCLRKDLVCEQPFRATTQTDARFIFEDGKSSTWTRPRSNTAQSIASSIADPSKEVDHYGDGEIMSPTSPASSSFSGSAFGHLDSPTAELSSSFESFMLDNLSFKRHAETCSLAQMGSTTMQQHVSAFGHQASDTKTSKSSLTSDSQQYRNLPQPITSENLSVSLSCGPGGTSVAAVPYSAGYTRQYGDNETNLTYSVQPGALNEELCFDLMQRHAEVSTTDSRGISNVDGSFESNSSFLTDSSYQYNRLLPPQRQNEMDTNPAEGPTIEWGASALFEQFLVPLPAFQS